jgi:hypothetical protein
MITAERSAYDRRDHYKQEGNECMLDSLLMLIAVISASFSIYYSFKTRTFRKQYYEVASFDPKKKPRPKEREAYQWMKFYNAKTNIAMGILLIAMAFVQFTFPELSGIRIGVGVAFLALGLFNFIMGLRNYRLFSPYQSSQKTRP